MSNQDVLISLSTDKNADAFVCQGTGACTIRNRGSAKNWKNFVSKISNTLMYLYLHYFGHQYTNTEGLLMPGKVIPSFR